VYNKYYIFRHPHTNNEKRANQDEYDNKTKVISLCRAKRRPRNLADAWDDKHHEVQKSWKVRRKRQYRGEKRGAEHQVFLEGWRNLWSMEEYFRQHDIPYKMERVMEKYTYTVPIYSKIVKRRVPNYVCRERLMDGKWISEICHQIGWREEYDFVLIGYQTKIGARLTGHNLVWWSDKDIGIEFILKQRGV
jgi:hypothetical protein